jgi:nicotinamidase-related amidase
MTQKVLVIVDMQTGCFVGDYPIHAGDALLAVVRDLIGRARAAAVPVVFVQHDGPAGDDLETGTPGWPIHPSVAPLPGEPVVRKQTPDGFHQTALQDVLTRLQADALIIAGLQTDLCLNATARRAAALGYAVTLVADGHSTWSFDGEPPAPEVVATYNKDWQSTMTVQPAAAVQF